MITRASWHHHIFDETGMRENRRKRLLRSLKYRFPLKPILSRSPVLRLCEISMFSDKSGSRKKEFLMTLDEINRSDAGSNGWVHPGDMEKKVVN